MEGFRVTPAPHLDAMSSCVGIEVEEKKEKGGEKEKEEEESRKMRRRRAGA